LLSRIVASGFCLVVLAAVGGCTPDYSPNTYSAAAMQQANKVERGVVVGYREVRITASGAVGAVTGGAAGGILGSQSYEAGVPSALGAVGGTLVGGLVGTAIEHASGDTTGWEYIVRVAKGDLVSLTQREPKPLPIGQKVLVITGKQARIIPDYEVDVAPDTDKHKKESGDKAKNAAPPAPAAPAATAAAATTPAPAAPAPATPTQAATPPATSATATAPAATPAAPPPAPADTTTAAPPPPAPRAPESAAVGAPTPLAPASNAPATATDPPPAKTP
jgi:outer membrane lipoprotein SlyB